MTARPRAARLALLLAIAVAHGAPASAQAPSPPIEILDAAVAEYDPQTETWVATGSPVRARRDGTEVTGARLRYSARDRIATAEGDARVTRSGQRLRAERLRADLASQDVVAEGAVVVEYDAAEGTVTLRAPRVAGNLVTRRYAATGGVDVVQPARGAALKAERVDADLATEVVVAVGDVVARWAHMTAESRVMRGDLRREVLWGEGNVRLRDPEVTATGDAFEVQHRDRLAILRGRVDARRGRDRLRANELRYEYERRILTAIGRAAAVVHPR